jgi:glutaminyl-tRNA synthetase
VRDDLNRRAPRAMPCCGVEGDDENTDVLPATVAAVNNPEVRRPDARGAVAGELYIAHDDFMENPPKKYFRLSPGGSSGFVTQVS